MRAVLTSLGNDAIMAGFCVAFSKAYRKLGLV